jgi:hypothetical protein
LALARPAPDPELVLELDLKLDLEAATREPRWFLRSAATVP